MKTFFKRIVVAILTFEARLLLRRKRPTIIAITGSVGKTSTKDAIYAAIKNDVYARKSEKSFNSDIGVALTVLGLPNAWNNPIHWVWNIIDGLFTAVFSRRYPSVLVLETGIDRPDDMAKLTRWLKPDVAVLTRLPDVPVHVEYFSSPEAVVAEKMKLVSALKPDGVVIHNADDPIIEAELPTILQKQVGFSRYLESDFTARADEVVYNDDMPAGVSFTVTHDDQTVSVKLENTVGTQHIYACTAALAVANELEIGLQNAATSLQSLQTPKGRLRVLPGIKGSVIIDDTYNSSPIAVEHALLTLRELKYAKRRIAVLGDMLELGKYSADEHRRLGAQVASAADVLFTIGVRARSFAEGALASGMHESAIFQYDDVSRAGRELQAALKPGDMVLVKASQSIRAERVVEEVMAEPERAPELLTRQDKTWKCFRQ